MDMEMSVEYATPSPRRPLPGSPNELIPGSAQPDPIAPTIAGRMPTPIQPSFAAQVRGNNWSGAAGNVMQPSGLPVPNAERPHFGLDGIGRSEAMAGTGFQDHVPRTLDHAGMQGWNAWQIRSLPSPISENGGEDMGSPTMVLDGMQGRSNSMDHTQPLPPRTQSTTSLLSVHSDSHIMQMQAANGVQSMDVGHYGQENLLESPGAIAAMDTDPPATPSPRKGHSRSRHTVNSWTLQAGMKRSFSIGYRADCEKCRNKVPGHFNHIIVS
jgi:hypothetical protein